MLTFVQSYISPKPMSADSKIYTILQEHFGGMRWIGMKGDVERGLNMRERLWVAVKTILQTGEDDFIFAWNAETALYVWFVGKVLNRPRAILGQNLMLNPKQMEQSKKTKLRGALYHFALKDRKFYVTVNSPELIPFYCNATNSEKSKFIAVYDSMTLNDYEKEIIERKSLNNNGLYIVGGG